LSGLNAQLWTSSISSVQLYSKTILENIDAITDKSSFAFNSNSGKIFVRIPIKSFKFEKKLMQEHFNENYMESDKFPHAEFSGLIQNKPDLSMDGTYTVTMKGAMLIHGVKKEVELPVTLVVAKRKIVGKSKFKVKCVDYNIEIPKIVVKNIAEEIELTVNVELNPHTK
jgi:polyisoprenoid-binding protein YceI